jgi:hypothetical protein
MSYAATDAAALDRDLQAARSRIDSRLTELQSRLSPGAVLDETIDYLKVRQGIDFGRNLADSIRSQPIPAALVGVGLAWLMAAPRGRAGYRSHGDRGYDAAPGAADNAGVNDNVMTRAWEAGRSVVRGEGESEIDYRGRVVDARAKVLGLARGAQETSQSFADRVEDALFITRNRVVGGARVTADRVGDMVGKVSEPLRGASEHLSARAHDVRDRVSGAARSVADRGRSAGDVAAQSYDSTRRAARTGSGLLAAIGENPVLLGAIGMTAGAFLGALLPTTELEEEYLGDAAADARETVGQAVHEAADRGADVTRSATEAGQQTATEVSRHVREFGGEAQDAASDVAGAAPDAGRSAAEAARSASNAAAMGKEGK